MGTALGCVGALSMGEARTVDAMRVSAAVRVGTLVRMMTEDMKDDELDTF